MKNSLFNSGKYYDLFYKDKDYKAEATSVHQKLIENKVTGKRLLELGCGTGKHAKIFSQFANIEKMINVRHGRYNLKKCYTIILKKQFTMIMQW